MVAKHLLCFTGNSKFKFENNHLFCFFMISFSLNNFLDSMASLCRMRSKIFIWLQTDLNLPGNFA